MPMSTLLRIIGLTGGIASGKSTVHEMLQGLGADIIDADTVYHDLIAPSRGQPSELGAAIGMRFAGTLLPDGSLDRRRLAVRVFADAEERAALEALAHPAVAVESARRCLELGARGAPFVIYDVPLLFERQLETTMAGVIVVWVPRDIQLARLMSREQLDLGAATERLLAQLPLDDKRRRVPWIIDNSGTREATLAQVRELWTTLQAQFGTRRP